MDIELSDLRTFTDALFDPVVAVDENLNILLFNPAAERLFEFSCDEILGKSLDLLIPDEFKSTHSSRANAFLQHESGSRAMGQRQSLQARKKDGKHFPVDISLTRLSSSGKPVVLSIIRDNSYHQSQLEQTQYRLDHDPLTGIFNRRFFDKYFSNLIKTSFDDDVAHLFFIDLDGFKGVNDNLGHQYGDLLLRSVAQRIKSCVRSVDNVCRFGGDEFVILIEGVRTRSELARIAVGVHEVLTRPFHLDDRIVTISGSIGIASYPEDGVSAVEILEKADRAMYVAKRNNHSHVFYSELT